MDEKEATEEPSLQEQCEYAATVEEKKVSIFFFSIVNMSHAFHNSIGSNVKVVSELCLERSYF